MNYKRYMDTRDLAWRVLLGEGVSELPVNVVKLCKGMGIRVQYYPRVDESDGYSTIFLGKPRIFVAEDCPADRKRFTIAHELGHILLGHVGRFELVNREPQPTDTYVEQAANMFACRILAPACVLWALDVRTPEQIMTLCQLTEKEAKYRARRMERLYGRNKFLTSPLERQVYRQFEDFIRRNQGRL